MRRYLVAVVLALLIVPIGLADIVGTGGTETTFTNSSGTFKVHTFTGNGTFTVAGTGTVKVLVLAGGGGGGGTLAGNGGAAGGGAGGLRFVDVNVSTGAYTISVGPGGAGGTSAAQGADGGQSSFGFIVNATGGGGGSRANGGGNNGNAGGSGGGAYYTAVPGAGNLGGYTPREGYSGSQGCNSAAPYYGGGGGGSATSAVNASCASTPGHGGNGTILSINGSAVQFGGGGGGGNNGEAGAVSGSGGQGGGGNGATIGLKAQNGTTNRGGGGGGGAANAGGNASNVNGGSGGSGIVIVQYESADVLTIIATMSNRINGSAWPSTATFSNVSGNLTFTFFNITGSGFCVSYAGNGTGTNCTAGSGASTFYDMTTTQLITTSDTVAGTTFGSLLRVNATMVLVGTPVSAFNVTNGALTNSTSSGTLTIAGNAGAQSVSIGVAGNYSMNATCTGVTLTTVDCEITGVYDNLFKINATAALTGAPVLNFSIVANYSGSSSSRNTSNGTLYVPTARGYSYTFTITSTGYAFSNVTRASNASTNTYQFSLLPQNSIFLYFFDQTTLDPILENVSVTFNNGSYSFSNSSNTSEMIASALTPGTWTITADAASYEPSQYFVTVGAGSSQDLDVYLLNTSLTGETTITIKDANTADVIQNATVTVQIKVGSNWVTFEQQTSDLFGVTFFQLEQGTEYQLIVEADGYDTKTGLFVRTTSSYVVTLSAANTQDFTQYGDDFSYAIVPEAVANNLTTFSITASSPGGALEWFAVVVTLNGSTTTQNVTGSPSGGTASVTLNLSGFNRYPVYATYYVKGVSFDDPLVISRSWVVYGFQEGNYTLSDFMTRYADDDNGFTTTSRGIIATIGAVLLGFLLGSIFGAGAAVLGAATVFIVAAFYGWIHWSIIAVVVGGLIAAFTLTGRSS